MEAERRKRVVSFEDLEVFQRAYRISLEIHRERLKFPPIEQRVLGDQLRRASKSICANVAEGYGRQKRVESGIQTLSANGDGSSDEIRVWVRYALDLGYIEEAVWKRWRDEYQAISRMLQSLSGKAEPRMQV